MFFHNLSERILPNKKIILLLLILTISVAYLISIRYGTLGDASIYLTAGREISLRNDPYLGEFRSGPVGAISLYIFSTLLPRATIEIVFQLLNLSGIFYFARRIIPKTNNEVFLVILILLTWSSPVREMIFVHQLNGIALGLATIALFTAMNFKKRLTRYTVHSLQSLCLLVSLELKPHLVVPIILYIVVKNKKYSLLLRTTILGLILHLVINIYTSLPLEILAYRKIVDISAIGSSTEWNEITNIWTVFDYFIPAYNFWYSTAVAASIISIILILKNSSKNQSLLPLTLCAVFPAITIYSQLHQMILISILICTSLVINKVNFLSVIALLFLFVPLEITNPRNWIFLAVISVALFWYKKISQREQSAKQIFLYFIAGILALTGLHLLIFGSGPWTTQITSRIVSVMMILGLLTINEVRIRNQRLIDNIFRWE